MNLGVILIDFYRDSSGYKKSRLTSPGQTGIKPKTKSVSFMIKRNNLRVVEIIDCIFCLRFNSPMNIFI